MALGYAERGFASSDASSIRVSGSNTSNYLSQLSFSNKGSAAGGVSWGLNAGTMTASVKDYLIGGLTTAMPSNSTTITRVKMSAGETSNNFSAITFSNSNNISFGLNASTLTGSYVPLTVSEWEPQLSGQGPVWGSLTQNALYLQPFDIDQYVNAYRLNFFLSLSYAANAANTRTVTAGWTFSYCLYTRDGANSRLNSLASVSCYVSVAAIDLTSNFSMNYPVGISNSTAVSSTSTSWANTTPVSNGSTSFGNFVAGFRVLPMPLSSTLSPGRYWLGVANRTSSTGSSNLNISAVFQHYTCAGNIAFRPFGTSSAASNVGMYGAREGLGTYSATTFGFPANIPLTSDSIRQAATGTHIFFNISGWTTGANWA